MRKRIMKVLFGEDLSTGEETSVEICRENGSRGEGIAVMEIFEEGRESAGSEEIEACPVETIIRIWRHDLQGGSAQNSFPAARSNVDKKRRWYTHEKIRGISSNI
jgi:hypothetical protein